ncbi:hypothetical protein Tco_0217651 [Tanacetum coccineum]
MKKMNDKTRACSTQECFYEKDKCPYVLPQSLSPESDVLAFCQQKLASQASKISTPATLCSNCLLRDLRSACDREHTKVLELEAEISKQKQLISESEKRFAFLEQNYVSLQLKFQNYKQCIDTSSASNAIFEINKLRQQLQGKDDTIRNLDLDHHMKDGLKVENVSLKKRFDELSKANTHSRTAHTENTKLKAQVTGTTSSGPSTSETPKVLAPGMYNLGSNKPQWKPTGRHFSLFEKYPLTRIMESTDMPIELPPSATSSPKRTMVSRFTDHKLSDRQAGNDLFQWFDEDELFQIPPVDPNNSVNVPAAAGNPKNAIVHFHNSLSQKASCSTESSWPPQYLYQTLRNLMK